MRPPFVMVKFLRRHSLALIIFIAVLIRIPAALYLGDQVTALPGIHDQISYNALAKSILAGNGYQFTQDWYPFTPANTPTAHWSFLYPLYLAGVYGLVGFHPLVARLVQAVVGGALVCLLLYAIGRRLFDRRVALLGAALSAVYAYFIYYNAALMTETFFIVAILLSLYLALELKEKPSVTGWAAFGFSMGVAALLRQTAFLVLPVILAWLIWELKGRIRLWNLLVPLLVIALLVLPWTARNYRAYKHFLLLNSNAGYALYAANNPGLEADWQADKVVVPIPPDLKGQNEAELNDALLKRAFGFILDDPGRYLLLTLDKSLEYFKFWPSNQSGLISNLSRVLSFGLYLPFMLWGLYLSLPHWRKYLPLYLFITSYSAIHLLSWPAPRYRLPVDSVLMLFAAFALLDLLNRFNIYERTAPKISWERN